MVGLASPAHLNDDHAFAADIGQVDEQPRRLACELPPVEEDHRFADGQFLGYLMDRCQAASNWAICIGLAPVPGSRLSFGGAAAAGPLLVRPNRLESTAEIANVAEQRPVEKAGFTREGILRGASFRQGRYRDYLIYSVLRDEVELEDCASGGGTA